jgi:hypothetical protein
MMLSIVLQAFHSSSSNPPTFPLAMMDPEITTLHGSGDGNANRPPGISHSGSSKNTSTTPSQQFIVGIGVNGVASALETLDESLRNVGVIDKFCQPNAD